MNNDCLLCHGTNLSMMIELKGIPIGHALLDRVDQAHDTFDLIHLVCRDCGLVQNINPIDPEVLYSSYNYNFSSWKHEPHFEHELDTIFAHGTPASAFEIGCNDGKFLKALHKRGVKNAYGVEPNPVPFKVAMEIEGLNVFKSMITPAIVEEVLAHRGKKFALVYSRQVIEHVNDLDNFFVCAKKLLHEDGILFLDFPDFEPALTVGDVSMLWEEHISNFSETSLLNMLQQHGFTLVEQNKYNFSGGTLSAIARFNTLPVNEKRLDTERIVSLAESFQGNVNAFGQELRSLLETAKKVGYEISLYGVGGRASIAVNTYGIGNLIDFAIDDQEERQGKFLPGKFPIKIHPREKLNECNKPGLVLLAVNNESEERVLLNTKKACTKNLKFLSIFGPSNLISNLRELNI